MRLVLLLLLLVSCQGVVLAQPISGTWSEELQRSATVEAVGPAI